MEEFEIQFKAQILAALSASIGNTLLRIKEEGYITYDQILMREIAYYPSLLAAESADQEIKRLKDGRIITEDEEGRYILDPDMPIFARQVLDVIFPPPVPNENSLRMMIIQKMEEHARKIADEIIRGVK